MDVYHKVLTGVYKDSGGKETVKVNVGEIIKKEGFFPSRDQITSHLVSEGWVTETDRRFVVKITHWGIAEAKKVLSDAPDLSRELEKDSKRLVSSVRELLVMVEEFAADPSKKGHSLIENRYSELGSIVSGLKSKLD